MLAVIDTNVLVSALLHGATPRRVYDAFLCGQLTPVFSPETLAELIDVLTRPSLRALMNDEEVAAFLTLIRRDALIVHPTRHVETCRDAKDNILLDCVLAVGRPACLVTGDHDLLALHPFRDISILRPSEFLRLLP